MPSAKTGWLSDRPSSVNAYSTCGGLVGYVVRVTMPSRSSPLKVRVSICCDIPSTTRLISLKRRGAIPKKHDDKDAPFVADTRENLAYLSAVFMGVMIFEGHIHMT
jgi:hypothetical protein